MDLIERLVKEGYEEQAEILERYAADSIRLKTEAGGEGDFELGESKIGGCPHLPPDFTWPKFENNPLSFLAQLNLADVARYDSSKRLPESGMLYFFHEGGMDVWGFDPNDRDGFRVIHYDGDLSKLKVTPLPNLKSKHEYLTFKPCKLTFENAKSYPDNEYLEMLSQIPAGSNKSFFNEGFDEIVAEYKDAIAPHHKLFGYPDLIQNEIFLEAQLVSNELYCGNETGYRDPRAEDLKEGAGDWMLLFQIDTDGNAEMMWGDCGMLYFVIKKDDLTRRNFDAAWAIVQCF
ncbi:MAG: DUF1963 domain-containing protein [Synergistaceae bacterium]|jgi:uncharacterized protein YwqG|nr:DUF1963 domain-containing protein [Synergistaceae bacterium]